jgi:single-strand DNA-binding protein
MNNNKIKLIGNLGHTPELKIVNKSKLTELSIAVNEFKRYRNGETRSKTQWHKVIVWGKLAELVKESSKKGTKLLIEGRLDSKNYIDKNGIKRTSTLIVAEEIVVNYTPQAA